jgi:hypothetical protein
MLFKNWNKGRYLFALNFFLRKNESLVFYGSVKRILEVNLKMGRDSTRA